MASDVVINFKGDSKQLDQTIGGVKGKLGSMGKVAAGAAVGFTGLAVGAGAALFKVGEEINNAHNIIVTGTGASGEALAGLKDDFRDLASDSPASMDEVATALADVNTALGLTGEPLQDLSDKMINLSRVTGADLGSTIQSSTRLFGDWGVAVEDQGATLDYLWSVSQATGMEVGALQDQMVKTGAPLRQLGISMEDSAALFGKWNKEGVNTDIIFSGVRSSISKFAREGKDIPEAFNDASEAIKNAGSASEATTLAIETFGSEAGPDMAAAIREGRFEIDDLVASLDGSEGSIDRTAEATETFGDKWQKIKNKVFLALEPLAMKLFDAITDGMDALGPTIDTVAAWFTGTLVPAFNQVGDIVAEYMPQIIRNFETVRDWVMQFWPQIQEIIVGVVSSIVALVELYVKGFTLIWQYAGDDIMAIVDKVWPHIEQVIGGVLKVISNVFKAFTALFKGDWAGLWEAVKGILSGAWDVITGLFGASLAQITGILGLLLNVVKDLAGKVGSALWNKIQEGVDKVISAISGIPGVLRQKASSFLDAGKSLGSKIIDGIKNGISGVVGIAGNLASAVKDKIKSAVNTGIIDKVNSALEVSFSAFGQTITIDPPDIPRLAAGGVTGINDPFIALIGDNKTQREIVTPEGLMRQVVRDELASVGAGNKGATVEIGTINMGNATATEMAEELYWRLR